jgi:hypothetical protein
MHRENAKGRQRETERVTEVIHCHSSVFRTFGLSRSIACTCRLRRVHTAAPALDTLVHVLSTPHFRKKCEGASATAHAAIRRLLVIISPMPIAIATMPTSGLMKIV